MNNTIGIIGCGWLGFPLATTLVDSGFKVNGSTTSKEKLSQLEQAGISPFYVALREDKIEGEISNFLQNIDILIVNVPPKLRGKNKENYVKKIQLLYQEIKKNTIKKIIFISSTSVYGEIEGDVTEATIPQPTTASGKQLLESENIFQNDTDLKTTIIRFGGLISADRHPITMLSGRENLANGNAPINLIHRNDCIRIIVAVIENSWWNETINGVYPKHPPKQNYYTEEAKKRSLQAPKYQEDSTRKGKKVHANVLLNVKNFDFTTTP